MNKKSVELSINFLVIVVISLTVLGFGIKFIYDLYGGAVEMRDLSLEDIDKQIENLMCEGTESVCISKDSQTIRRGDLGIFGIKIINLAGNSADFSVTATPKKLIKKGGGEDLPPFSDVECLPECGNPRIETILNHEEKDIAIGIKPGKNAGSGTYIFDIVVCYNDNNPGTSDTTGKCSNDLYYFSKIYAKVP